MTTVDGFGSPLKSGMFLPMLFVFCAGVIEAERVRYTLLPNKIVGESVEKGKVGHVDECSALAIAENRAAFRVEYRNEKIFCFLFVEFEKFTKRIGFQVLDYILDTQLNDDVCRADAERNVLNIISGKCSLRNDACELLSKVNNYCRSVGKDVPSCLECPEGFVFKKIFQNCVGVFPFIRNHSLASHDEVNSQCGKGSSLVTIENALQNAEIADLTPAESGVVIGLRIPKRTEWSKDGFEWADGSTSTYRNWAPREPGNQDNSIGELFVALLKQQPYEGRWGDADVNYVAGAYVGYVACMWNQIDI